MARMKALKSFLLGSTGKMVQPGEEFETTTALHYENKGMAVLVADVVATRAPNAAEPNKAAEQGPLASLGGKTGAGNAPLLSQAAPRPRGRPSKKSKDAPA